MVIVDGKHMYFLLIVLGNVQKQDLCVLADFVR